MIHMYDAEVPGTLAYNGRMTFGVIFDMDGVLVDSTEAHYQAWKRVGEAAGHPYSRDAFLRTFGMHNNQSIPAWFGRPVPEAEIRDLADRKERLYREMARTLVRPVPGVVDLIRALARDGFKLAVGSSGPSENVAMALDLLQVRDAFAALSTGDEVKEGKPHPAIFLNAAHQLGLPPAQCAVIEDAPQGIQAAHAAGMLAIAIPTSRPAADLADADWFAASLKEVTPEGIRRRLTARV